MGFAPHTRGSTLTAYSPHLRPPGCEVGYVCPAHAGVYPSSLSDRFQIHVPGSFGTSPGSVCPAHAGVYRFRLMGRVSCRIRGYSRYVCPAHAGVYRRSGHTRRLCPAHAGVYRPFGLLQWRLLSAHGGSTPDLHVRVVCPAHAGVYPVGAAKISALRLPRTRGGLPESKEIPRLAKFAPHTRGSTGEYSWHFGVCPAHALPCIWVQPKLCLPRTRGGLPDLVFGVYGHTLYRPTGRIGRARQFAPHTRGSTGLSACGIILVCPAHAGVYPVFVSSNVWTRSGSTRSTSRSLTGAPHTRGFAPHTRGVYLSASFMARHRASGNPPALVFAPHTRGSTVSIPGYERSQPPRITVVCPAHAGVYRQQRRFARFQQVCPAHAGVYRSSRPRATADSPRTRLPSNVWSLLVCPAHAGVYPLLPPQRPLDGRCDLVCPAHAGVYRPVEVDILSAMRVRLLDRFAPHTRGSTGEAARGRDRGADVCPAHAGVYRVGPFSTH